MEVEGRVMVPGQADTIIPGLCPVWHRALDELPVGVSFANLTDGGILYSNRAFDRIAGTPSGFFKNAFEFVDQACVHESQREMLRAQVRGTLHLQGKQDVSALPEIGLDILGGDGKLRNVQHYAMLMHEVGIVVAIFRDVTETQQEYTVLRKTLLLDPLTGIANRRGLQDRWQREMRSGLSSQLGFLMVDLDNFKPINDMYGHDIGDEVLRLIAKRLEASVRRSDFVCRFGGDEFGILLANPDGFEQIKIICDRIIKALEQPFEIGSKSLRVGASIGGCLYPAEASDMDQLLRRADRAMYRIKNNGKNGWGWHAA